jgi:hypothetical protein
VPDGSEEGGSVSEATGHGVFQVMSKPTGAVRNPDFEYCFIAPMQVPVAGDGLARVARGMLFLVRDAALRPPDDTGLPSPRCRMETT